MTELTPHTGGAVPPESRFILSVYTAAGSRRDSHSSVRVFSTQSWHSAEQPSPEQIRALTGHRGYSSYTIEERQGDGWKIIRNSDHTAFQGGSPGRPNRMGDAWVPARFRDRARKAGSNVITDQKSPTEITESTHGDAGSLALTLEVNLIFGVHGVPSPEQVQAISEQVAGLLQQGGQNTLKLPALHVESQVQATYLNRREGLALHQLILPGPPGGGQLHLSWSSDQVIGQEIVPLLRSVLREALFLDEPWVAARLEADGAAHPLWNGLRERGVHSFTAELI